MRRRKRRTLIVGTAATTVAAFVLVLGTLTGSASVRTQASNNRSAHPATARLRSFQRLGVRFQYPAAWAAHTYPDDVSSFSTLIVYLSNQQLHPPCVTHHGQHVITKICGPPVDHLAPASILASWTADGFPGWTFSHAKGKPLRVGGHLAKLLVTHSACGIGADVTMDVVVDEPAVPYNWYELRACIKGPGINRFKQQVRALLKTVHFDH
jgi:hypothetical protein